MNDEFEFELPDPMVSIELTRLPFEELDHDWIADEVPVALTYNGISHAVMMCTPSQIEEFAVGFSVTEGIVPSADQIYGVELQPGCEKGIVANIEIAPEFFMALKNHRRNMTGRTGCGLCGTENLEMIRKKFNPLGFTTKFDLAHYDEGFRRLKEIQVVGGKTGSTHSVAVLDEQGNFLGGAEDIGRHVAMDKAIGFMLRNKWRKTVFFISSRASYEMVQKAIVAGVEIVFAISAPTSRAVELAKEANLTLVAFCRSNKANVYSCPERLLNAPNMKTGFAM